MLSWLEKLREGLAEQSERASDPWRRVLERALPADVTAVSTVALCNLLGIRPTTGNARRIARTMRALGFFPVKSRKLLPGGWRGTEGRGWARPVRQPKLQVSIKSSVKGHRLTGLTACVKRARPSNHPTLGPLPCEISEARSVTTASSASPPMPSSNTSTFHRSSERPKPPSG